jgi:hypothetical protein
MLIKMTKKLILYMKSAVGQEEAQKVRKAIAAELNLSESDVIALCGVNSVQWIDVEK